MESESEHKHVRVPTVSGASVMGNLLLLTKIARQMRAKELRTLRRTCENWRNTFEPELKKKCRRQIGVYARRGCFCCGLIVGIQHRVNQLVDLQREAIRLFGRNLPFSNYHIALASKSSQQTESFNLLMDEIGPGITQLGLEADCELSTALLGAVIFYKCPLLENFGLFPFPDSRFTDLRWGKDQRKLLKEIPNLKVLRVSSPEEIMTSPPLALLISDVIDWAPKLESLKFLECAGEEEFLAPILQNMSNWEIDLQKLKTLELEEVNLGILQPLVRLGRSNGLHLRTFSTKVRYFCEGDEENLPELAPLFDSFLDGQASSLRCLKLAFRCPLMDVLDRPATAFHIPRMEHLRFFQWSRGSPVDVHFHGGSFAQAFPNLRSFVYFYEKAYYYMEDTGAINHHENFVRDIPQMYHPGVISLDVNGLSNDQFLQLPARFPSVKKLDVWTESDSGDVTEFDEGWTLWPDLIKLNGVARPGANTGVGVNEIMAYFPARPPVLVVPRVPRTRATARQQKYNASATTNAIAKTELPPECKIN